MPNTKVGRRKPYTRRGIVRCRCVRCGEPAAYQWQAREHGNRYAPVCARCDLVVNQLTLGVVASDGRRALLAHYKDSHRRQP